MTGWLTRPLVAFSITHCTVAVCRLGVHAMAPALHAQSWLLQPLDCWTLAAEAQHAVMHSLSLLGTLAAGSGLSLINRCAVHLLRGTSCCVLFVEQPMVTLTLCHIHGFPLPLLQCETSVYCAFGPFLNSY